ncbi:MAG TPA: lanthionine synthetase LanC family protein [Ruminiclostridium sp.]|nr:lanthionine synthetase LanC family protein [Ruminiclostridium sp.]
MQKSILGTKGGIVDRTWIGSTEVFKDYYDITCIGNDIYGGNSGIALFLASLGLISGEEKFKAAAIESILPVINCMEVNHNLKNVKIGFFSGISGWLYSIFHIGRMLCDSRLIDYVYQKIWLIKNLINTEENCDVLSGLSGSLGAVLSICENTESKITRELLLELCLEIYSKIIEKAKMLSGNKGVIWGNEGFVGYSHGNAGIAAQIARLNRGVKNSSLFDVVNSSLRYERQMFLKQYGNWKTQLNKEGYSNSWCHGAPGVLLCKLQLEEYGFTDSKMKEEIEIAIESVKREGFGKDYCLCHGDMGNLLILNKAARLIADSGLKACCEITLEDIAKNYIDEVILKNQGDRIVDLNLMTGAAGIGYSLLQFYKPGLLPDILSLE